MIRALKLSKGPPSISTTSPGFRNLLSDESALNTDDNLSSLSILSNLASPLFQHAVLFSTASGQYFDNDTGKISSSHPVAFDPKKVNDIVDTLEDYLATKT